MDRSVIVEDVMVAIPPLFYTGPTIANLRKGRSVTRLDLELRIPAQTLVAQSEASVARLAIQRVASLMSCPSGCYGGNCALLRRQQAYQNGTSRRAGGGNSSAGEREVDLVRTLILIGTALGLGAGLVCTSLFAW
ncbi:hypothetical protein Pd630_LPD11005 (plasmid) [Rhodococcus opacus PD630]|nr:hypothetical protein Pd630_LPD11005 [Rhodococcus opacus PD630]